MTSTVATPVRWHAQLQRIGHIALDGPAVGAVLLGAVLLLTESNFRFGRVHYAGFDWQIALRLAISGLCGLYGLLNLSYTRHALVRFPGAWALLLGGWTAFTVLMAVDKPYSAAASGSLWSVILFAPAVIRQLSGRQIVLVTFASLVAYAIGSWIVFLGFGELGRTEFTLPDLSIIYRFGGLSHANTTARIAAMGVAVALMVGCERLLPWRYVLAALGLFGATILATDSRTGMIAAALAAAMHVRYVPARLRTPIIAAGLVLVGLVAVAGNYGPEKIMAKISRSGDAEEIYGMTGRTDVWAYVVDKIKLSPFVGYGYGCSRFAMVDLNDDAGQDMAGFHAHNLILNVTLGAGIPAGLLLVAAFLSQGINMLLRPRIFPDVIFVLVMIGGIADAVMLNPIADSFTVLWLIALFWRQMGATLHPEPHHPTILETA